MTMMNLLILWIVFISCIVASDLDESIDNLHKYQLAVENNQGCTTSIGIRFNTSTVVVLLTKATNDSGVRSKSSRFLVLDRALVSIVAANESDYRLVRQGCIDYDSEFRINKGDSISASMLALCLSNDAQASLQKGEKPLPCNCLLVSNDESLELNSSLGGIMKVDMSGNFESYRAFSIGYLSNRINKWLETRGVYIASQILEQRSVCKSSTDSCPYISVVEDADIQSCLSILWDCLHENFGLSNLNQTFIVELSTVQQQKRTNYFKRVLPRVSHFLKPVTIPPQVFTNLSSTDNSSVATECYSDSDHTGSSRLFRWWRMKRDANVVAGKSGMTLQWRKL